MFEKIIKRSGAEVDFDPKKIEIAVKKANESVVPSERMSDIQIKRIAEDVESAATNVNRSLSVEEIQDMVEDQIMNQRCLRCCAQIHNLPLSARACEKGEHHRRADFKPYRMQQRRGKAGKFQ